MKSNKILLIVFWGICACALILQSATATPRQTTREQVDSRLADRAKLTPLDVEKMMPFPGVRASRRTSDGQGGERKPAPNNNNETTARASSQESERSRKRDEWQRPAEVFDGLAVKPGHRVADIGSGHGYFTFRLAARVGAEGKVYAVDIDEEAINKVRQRKEREKLDQVEAILGESADPRLPSGLDSVLIVDSYHEFREYDQTLQAVFAALKPGGRLVIIDGEGPSGRPRTEYHRLHVIPAEIVREEAARHGFVFKESRPGFYDQEYGKKMYFIIFQKP
ncbi:MAG: methyltransferase domain-containing protein [Blastocatellales bacterium]